jgi:hypothetical protein
VRCAPGPASGWPNCSGRLNPGWWHIYEEEIGELGLAMAHGGDGAQIRWPAARASGVVDRGGANEAMILFSGVGAGKAHRNMRSAEAHGLVKGIGGEDANQRSLGLSHWSRSSRAIVGSSRWWRLVRGKSRAACPCGGTRRQTKSKAASGFGVVFGLVARG